MSTDQNMVERAYRKLNSATKITVSLEEWITLLACALAIAVPQLTGIPWKYASPATLFVTFSVVVLIRRGAAWQKNMLINLVGCAVLYFVLAFFGSNH